MISSSKYFYKNKINEKSIEAQKRESRESVQLRGTFLKGRKHDLPTLIWFSDLIEPVENFEKFFIKKDNKILDVRNIWLLNYRNMGHSDHHESFDMSVGKVNKIILMVFMLGYFFRHC